MRTTATLHVHPTCTHNRQLIEHLQASTGCLILIQGGKPRLIPKRQRPAPINPSGGRAA
ncbi:putative uncharacterized protein [Pseudomonas sp. StFLB209]|uniref:hypothetical protein n=1 Tax=Pseudomonas sp. StFLB209 TaxID=1028989 RepID=UPI0004F7815B|nr:hypothetical protein [Pseudomonas sp. StFLB209]BAP44742.1 putative uncharacterized protein [Pseudomonas sp. StFLB209]